MLVRVRAAPTRRSRRAVVLCVVALVGVTVTAAHSQIANDHMGEAFVVCVAVLSGGVAAASLPSRGRWLRRPHRALDAMRPRLVRAAVGSTPIFARGDPVALQVLRH
jgi:hypothetical protein